MVKRDTFSPEIYLDNAATMTKFKEAIEAEKDFYLKINANPLRGLYQNSILAEQEIEDCRRIVRKFFDASNYEVIFTRGTTEAINLVANGLALRDDGFGVISQNDTVCVDIYSHHSNILPWRQNYQNIELLTYEDDVKINNPKVFSLTGVSNVTGENLIQHIKTIRKKYPDVILGVDGAQLVAHANISMNELNLDFLAFSGHKIGAPMGVGCLIIKTELAQKLRPLHFGGEMVDAVKITGLEREIVPYFSKIPERLEGGTLPVGGIIGLKVALNKLMSMDLNIVNQTIAQLVQKSQLELSKYPRVRILAANGVILCFNIDDIHPHDVAQILADDRISVRAGFMCAQPLLEYKDWGPVVRASFSLFNNFDDVDRLVKSVSSVSQKMGLS